MPTRKEILKGLGDSISDLSGAITANAEEARASSDAIDRQSDSQRRGADAISDGVKKAGHDVAGGLFVAGIAGLVGQAIIDRVREINMRTDLINSILALQERYDTLTYEFIVDRAYAQGSDTELRRNILNELICGGVVTITDSEQGEVLSIDPTNPILLAYAERVQKAKEGD